MTQVKKVSTFRVQSFSDWFEVNRDYRTSPVVTTAATQEAHKSRRSKTSLEGAIIGASFLPNHGGVRHRVSSPFLVSTPSSITSAELVTSVTDLFCDGNEIRTTSRTQQSAFAVDIRTLLYVLLGRPRAVCTSYGHTCVGRFPASSAGGGGQTNRTRGWKLLDVESSSGMCSRTAVSMIHSL